MGERISKIHALKSLPNAIHPEVFITHCSLLKKTRSQNTHLSFTRTSLTCSIIPPFCLFCFFLSYPSSFYFFLSLSLFEPLSFFPLSQLHSLPETLFSLIYSTPSLSPSLPPMDEWPGRGLYLFEDNFIFGQGGGDEMFLDG